MCYHGPNFVMYYYREQPNFQKSPQTKFSRLLGSLVYHIFSICWPRKKQFPYMVIFSAIYKDTATLTVPRFENKYDLNIF